MSNEFPQTSPSTTTKEKWRYFKIAAGVLLGLTILVKIIAGTGAIDLEVTRKGASSGDDGRALEIVNTGSKPIMITGIVVNEREDCVVQTIDQVAESQSRLFNKPTPGTDAILRFKSANLGVGEALVVITSCRVVRATLNSESGSSTYSFNR